MDKITETLKNLGIEIFMLAILKEFQLATVNDLLPFFYTL
jgi:hypothetical protein